MYRTIIAHTFACLCAKVTVILIRLLMGVAALTLTGELEVYMHDEPEEEDIEVKLSEEFEKIETSLWKTEFHNTQFTAYRYEVNEFVCFVIFVITWTE